MIDYNFLDYEEMLSVPLYKYYGTPKYAIDVIENHRIHFELPEKFNDIYDSATYLKDTELEKAIISGSVFIKALSIFLSSEENKLALREKISPLLKEKKQVKTKDVVDIANMYLKNITKKEFLDGLRKVLALERLVVPSSQRISCFSENNDSLLMWAYYAKCHKGVCLEFDFKNNESLRKHCHKVQYTKHFDVGNFSYTYFTKSLEWSHEQEWRIVLFGSEYMPTDNLRAVYLGYKMHRNTKARFKRLCEKHKLDLYEAKPSLIEYKLGFKQILKKGNPVN